MSDDFRNHTPATNAAYEAAIGNESGDESIALDRMRDFAAGLERTLRDVESRALALSEFASNQRYAEQEVRDNARAIAAMCAAALAGK